MSVACFGLTEESFDVCGAVLAGVDCVHKCRMERFHQSAKVKSGTAGMHFTLQSLFLFGDCKSRIFYGLVHKSGKKSFDMTGSYDI